MRARSGVFVGEATGDSIHGIWIHVEDSIMCTFVFSSQVVMMMLSEQWLISLVAMDPAYVL